MTKKPDYEETARFHVAKADEWANRDNVLSAEVRTQMVDYNLRLAEIYATLAVAQKLEMTVR